MVDMIRVYLLGNYLLIYFKLNIFYWLNLFLSCEYRHNQNVRIGINGSFGMTSVVGDHPCVK